MQNIKQTKIFIASIMMAISSIATAQFDDTFVFRECIKQSNIKSISDLEKDFSWEKGYCIGFIQSLKGSNEILKKSVPSKAFCAPNDINNEFELLKAIIKQAEMDNELKGYPDRYELSRQALQKAYPCDKNR